MKKRRGKAWSKSNVGALSKNRRDVSDSVGLSTLKLVMWSEYATDDVMMVDHR